MEVPLVEASTVSAAGRDVAEVVAAVVAGAATVEAAGQALREHETEVVAAAGGRQALADYLGSTSQAALLQAFVAAAPLQTADFECALRHFLAHIALPREAGGIGRACDAFAQHFYASAADDAVFADADAVATLTAALLILNPDQHSRAVHRRMTARAFARWLRGANGGHDFPPWFLAALHANVSSLALSGSTTTALKCGWLAQRIGLRSLRRWFVVDAHGLLSRRRPDEEGAGTRYAVATLAVVAAHGYHRHRAGTLVLAATCGTHAHELRLHTDCDEAAAAWLDAVRTCIAHNAFRTHALSCTTTATTTTTAAAATRAKIFTRSAAVAEIASQHQHETTTSSTNDDCECASVRVDEDLVLHVVLARDTARCLREARRVLAVVLRHRQVLLLPRAGGTQPFCEVERGAVVFRAPAPEDLRATCRGFYVRMNCAADLALAVHWDDRAAASLASARQWLPCSDPAALRLFDAAPAFFARAFRAWIAFAAA